MISSHELYHRAIIEGGLEDKFELVGPCTCGTLAQPPKRRPAPPPQLRPEPVQVRRLPLEPVARLLPVVPRTAPNAWRPLCMTPEDYGEWADLNDLTGHPVARPCIDCPAFFAAEMLAEGKCNGTPGRPR